MALLVAAGSGARFGGDVPKQYRLLAGRAILRRTAEAFLSQPAISGVRVVINPDHRDLYDAATAGLGLPEPVVGGATRQESGRLGLEALAREGAEFVLIHDAARPLVSAATIMRSDLPWIMGRRRSPLYR